ncbi:unnamed protein product [Auanema sp. JU1783]|nr:unnamed protein product [Auanema sp. JU1783]
MSTFESPSLLRQFEMLLDGRSLFVNAHWMAELSPYFHQICFCTNFDEARTGRVEMRDVHFSDVLQLLNYCCPDKEHLFSKKIDDLNFAALIHCSNRFQIPTVQRDLEKFIEIEMSRDTCKLTPETLIDVIIEANYANYRPSLMLCIYKKLSNFGEVTIREALKAKQLPEDSCKAVMEETAKYIKVIHPPIIRHNNWDTRHNYNWEQRVFF